MVVLHRFMFLLIILLTLVQAQTVEEDSIEVPQTPCEHPLVHKALEEGLNSLTLKEIPEYWYRIWLCKRYANKAGVTIDLSIAQERKREELQHPIQEISGPGACCATMVTVILVFSYYSYFAGPDK